MPRSTSTIGKMLVKSLTSDQIADLLTVVSESTDLNQFMDGFTKIDPDMAATVKKILAARKEPASKGKTKPLTSLKRTMEFWASLWRRFDDIIGEVGDEKGKYAVQDHHWEPPYFDRSSLAYDLESIAKDMLGLIDDVYDEVNDPDLFLNALQKMDDQINSYPEWMGVEYGEPCVLEESMTQCVLAWLWRSLQHERNPGSRLSEKTISLENAFEMVALDGKALTAYYARLPDEVCREIYDFLQEGDHGANLESTYSAWHQIHHAFEERFDPESYLESCRKHLANNWRYGNPDTLIEEIIVEAHIW